MEISVILCTYNRCQNLVKALESIALSDMPTDTTWEVLIVDNNSKDETRKTAEDFCSRYPRRFRYVFEQKQGKSNALNTGIEESQGSILAFMDDDVIVHSAWLRNITSPLRSTEWAGAGGRIAAKEDFETPPWLALEGPFGMAGMFALFDFGDEAGELKSPPFGTSMAFQKKMFEKYGGFRTDMGPKPGSEIRNEDTEFGRRIMAAGERLWYAPGAVVYHGVPEKRLTQRYLMRWWYDHGRATVRERGPQPPEHGLPSWCVDIPRMLIRPFRRMVRSWLRAEDPKARFYYKCQVCTMIGEMVEAPRVWLAGPNEVRKTALDRDRARPSAEIIAKD